MLTVAGGVPRAVGEAYGDGAKRKADTLVFVQTSDTDVGFQLGVSVSAGERPRTFRSGVTRHFVNVEISKFAFAPNEITSTAVPEISLRSQLKPLPLGTPRP